MKSSSSSKFKLLAAAVAAVGATAAVQVAHAAPTVTYILSIDDNGKGVDTSGDFAVYATDSTGDNFGIAGIGVNLANVTLMSINDQLPVANVDDGTGEGNDDLVGFSLKHNNKSLPVGGSQDTADLAQNISAGNPAGYYMVYGIGQVAQNLNTDYPVDSTGPDGNTIPGVTTSPPKQNPFNPAIAGPSTSGGFDFGMLVATGTYTVGTLPSFTVSNQSANVFVENGNANFNPAGGNTVAANIAFVTQDLTPTMTTPTTLFSLTATGGNGGTDDASAFGAADVSDVVTVGPGHGNYVPLKASVSNNKGFFDYAGFTQGDNVDIALKFTDSGGNLSSTEIASLIAYINANDGTAGTIASAYPTAGVIEQGLGPNYDILLSTVAGANDPFADYDFSGFTDSSLEVTGIGVVPEPASLSLLALGGLGLISRRRK